MLVWCAAWKQHVSLYPLSATMRRDNAAALEGYEMAKGTVRFPLTEPIPAALVRRLVKARLVDVNSTKSTKTTKKTKNTKKGPRTRRRRRHEAEASCHAWLRAYRFPRFYTWLRGVSFNNRARAGTTDDAAGLALRAATVAARRHSAASARTADAGRHAAGRGQPERAAARDAAGGGIEIPVHAAAGRQQLRSGRLVPGRSSADARDRLARQAGRRSRVRTLPPAERARPAGERAHPGPAPRLHRSADPRLPAGPAAQRRSAKGEHAGDGDHRQGADGGRNQGSRQYFSSIKVPQYIRVVESDTVPTTRIQGEIYFADR